MSVCGGWRGGFSFNPGLLTSMNFRHGCGGGREGVRAGPAAGERRGGERRRLPGDARGRSCGLDCALSARAPRTAAVPAQGQGSRGAHPPDFARAGCTAGSEGRDRAAQARARDGGARRRGSGDPECGESGRGSAGGTPRGPRNAGGQAQRGAAPPPRACAPAALALPAAGHLGRAGWRLRGGRLVLRGQTQQKCRPSCTPNRWMGRSSQDVCF